jgi:hypothetical protein
MKNNDAESEDSGPEVNSSESDSEMSDSTDSSVTTENELRIGKKITDFNEVLGIFSHTSSAIILLILVVVELERQFSILREELYKERIKYVTYTQR